MKKLLFLFNPHTGGGRLKNKLLEILCLFSAAGYELSVWPTKAQGNARDIVRNHAAGHDLLVCCGGDGTMNEVVDGLKDVDPKPLVGYIPGGTTNDFAASLQLPRSDMLAAAERIISPKKLYQCDYGTFNGRAFTYVAAFGAFTDVPYKTKQNYKNALGYFAYLVGGIQELTTLKPTHVKVVCEEGEFEGDYLLGMVTNSVSVAGFKFSDEDHKVQMNDGLFEMVLVRQPQKLGDLAELYAALTSGNFSSPLLTVVKSGHIRLASAEPISWTLDGEFGGQVRETDIQVRRRELLICI